MQCLLLNTTEEEWLTLLMAVPPILQLMEPLPWCMGVTEDIHHMVPIQVKHMVDTIITWELLPIIMLNHRLACKLSSHNLWPWMQASMLFHHSLLRLSSQLFWGSQIIGCKLNNSSRQWCSNSRWWWDNSNNNNSSSNISSTNSFKLNSIRDSNNSMQIYLSKAINASD